MAGEASGPFLRQFEQQLAEARARTAAEAERQRQEQREREDEELRKKRREQRRQQAIQERSKAPDREQVVLPTSVEEALALLHLTAPVTARDVRRAYRVLAFRAHPDRGGSHGAMVVINAAYEIALAAC